MADILVSVILSYQWSDVPSLVESILTGQTALMAMVNDRKDVEKFKRLEGIIGQVAASFEQLAKMHSSEMAYELPSGVKAQLDEIRNDLKEYQKFIAENGVVNKSKFSSRGQFLETMIEKLLHSIKVLRFALTLAGYVIKQKSSSLSKLIADPLACDQWSQRFGGDMQANAEFKDVLDFLDTYFHNYGENCIEFENSCDNGDFFSWYRHDGAWCKCEQCIAVLKDKLLVSTQKSEVVQLNAFARFCGPNLLISIKNLIKEAHKNASNKYELLAPFLHIEADLQVELSQEVSKAQKKALKYNRILFVGTSNLLADMHQSICRELCQSVNKIESVADVETFADWVDEHLDELNAGKGKVMIVTTCQHLNCSNDSDLNCKGCKSEGPLLARKVYDCLYMNKLMTVGFCMLTCPFVSHGAEQVEELNGMLKGFFATMCLSSDARELSNYVNSLFALPKETETGEKKVKAKGNKMLTEKADAGFLKMLESGPTAESSKTAPAALLSMF